MPTLYLPPDRRPYFRDKGGTWAFYQHQDAVEKHTLDWSQELGSATISTSSWTASGVTTSGAANTTTTTSITVTGSGGYVENTITTSDSRTLVKRLRLITHPMEQNEDYPIGA